MDPVERTADAMEGLRDALAHADGVVAEAEGSAEEDSSAEDEVVLEGGPGEGSAGTAADEAVAEADPLVLVFYSRTLVKQWENDEQTTGSYPRLFPTGRGGLYAHRDRCLVDGVGHDKGLLPWARRRIVQRRGSSLSPLVMQFPYMVVNAWMRWNAVKATVLKTVAPVLGNCDLTELLCCLRGKQLTV